MHDSLAQSATDSATVTVASAVVADAGPDKTIASGGSTTLLGAASGGVGPYTYSWSPATGLNNASIAQPTASPTRTTTYTLTVHDSLAQSATDSATVTVASAESRNLYISDVTGRQGQQVLPTVTIDEAGTIAGFQIDVRFDANSKTLLGVAAGNSLTSNWEIHYAEPGPGVVRILAYSTTSSGLPAGDGELAVITFQERSDAPAGTTSLSFDSALFSDSSGSPMAPVATHDGSNTVVANTPPSADFTYSPRTRRIWI